MPVLSWSGTRFEFRCRAGQGAEAKDAGFHHSWRDHCYWTGLTDVARKLERFADDRAKAKLNFVSQQIEMSKSLNPAELGMNYRIPITQGNAYLPFQEVGILMMLSRLCVRDNNQQFLINDHNNIAGILLADEMGLGKTWQAIGFINSVPTINNILIVPPAGLLMHWERALCQLMTRSLSGDYAATKRIPSSNIVLCNYEIACRAKTLLAQREWDLIIADESHYLKNPDAKRTQALLGAEGNGNYPLEAKTRLHLTGSPILNRPVELWPQLRVLDPQGLGLNFWLFGQRFCGVEGESGQRDFSGASNLDELNNRLRAGVMIRRMKANVLSELPPKRRQIVPIPAPPGNALQAVRREMDFYAGNRAAVDEAIQRAEAAKSAGDEESYREAGADLRSLKKVMFEEMARLRKETAIAKIPYGISYIEDMLEQVDKLVVFAHHGDVINAVADHFGSIAWKMTQATPVMSRQLLIDRFQQPGRQCRLAVGSIGTMGVGWTMHAASHVLFLELDWRPPIITQAEDRLHRIGQRENVSVYHLVFDGSLDANQVKRIIEKQAIIDASIN